MPLVTTDAPPMNEYQPLRTIPVTGSELVSVLGNHPLTSNHLDPADLARILEDLYQTDIAEASDNARSYVVQEHSWDKAGRMLRQAMRR